MLELPNIYIEQFSNLRLRIRFKGKYLLAVSEALLVVDQQIKQIDYRYHFQDEQNEIIFRYDSTPHFPELPTFPHHKHLSDTVIAANKPELEQVFQEASNFAAANDS